MVALSRIHRPYKTKWVAGKDRDCGRYVLCDVLCMKIDPSL